MRKIILALIVVVLAAPARGDIAITVENFGSVKLKVSGTFFDDMCLLMKDFDS